MILGEYPCCGEPLMLSMPDETPVFASENCPNCGKVVWHRFSRVSPESWTELEFLKIYKINHKAKSIHIR